jgi:GAF domain-containing protein
MSKLSTGHWIHQLARIHQITAMVAEAYDVETALRTIIDNACEMIGADIGALGIPGEPGEPMAHFITSGLAPETAGPEAHPPVGRGVLSILLGKGESVRLANVSQHPYFEGFPTRHPDVGSFLGVPIQISGKVLGDLYLANKHNGEPFTEEDQQVIELLAGYAAVVVQSLLYQQQSLDLAMLSEREAFARQLQDDVLQAMYGVGLLIDNLSLEDPVKASEEIKTIRGSLNVAIESLRGHLNEYTHQ